MSAFKRDLLAACQSYVPHQEIKPDDLGGVQFLDKLREDITDLLSNEYPHCELNPSILDGKIYVIADEDWEKKNDAFQVVYYINGNKPMFISSGAVQ